MSAVSASEEGIGWRDAEVWVEYVERAASCVDAGRERLRTHHPELVYGQRASLLVPLARVAVIQVAAAIRRRTQEFAVGYLYLPNSVSRDVLRTEILAACALVRDVHAKLSQDVEAVLIDDVLLPNPTPIDRVRLLMVQRQQLVSVQQLFYDKTQRFINHAVELLVSGHKESITSWSLPSVGA